MNLLAKLFSKNNPSLTTRSGEPKASGELIAEATGGANLVEGRQTWELAEEKKHDLEHMKRCCEAELQTMEAAGIVAAPYYFERVAILSRKARNYQQEVHYCETYVRSVNEFYARHGTAGMADVRKGPRYKSIATRLEKARKLLAESDQADGPVPEQ